MKRITTLSFFFVLSFVFAMSAFAQTERPNRVQPFATPNTTAQAPATQSTPNQQRIPVQPIPQTYGNIGYRSGRSGNVVRNYTVKKFFMNGVDKDARAGIVDLRDTQNKHSQQIQTLNDNDQLIDGKVNNHEHRIANIEWWTGWPALLTFLFFLGAIVWLVVWSGLITRALNCLTRDYRRFEGDFYQDNLGYGNQNCNALGNKNMVAVLMPYDANYGGGRQQLAPAPRDERRNYYRSVEIYDRDLDPAQRPRRNDRAQ